jgi:hypothetical protein
MSTVEQKADVHIIDNGTIVTFYPCSPDARKWLVEHVVAEPYQWFGGNLCVEHHYADDLINALISEGLSVA